jgi:hypothetical protein
MKNYFKEGTFLLFPFAFLLLFAAVHEDDEFWTPVFLIGGIWSLIVGIGGIFAFESSQKIKIKNRKSCQLYNLLQNLGKN